MRQEEEGGIGLSSGESHKEKTYYIEEDRTGGKEEDDRGGSI